MKKVYSKPEIIFEDFTLNENIAAGCEIKVEGSNSGNCAYNSDLGIVFTLDVTACGEGSIVQDSENNGFCYHVPIATNNLFNS